MNRRLLTWLATAFTIVLQGADAKSGWVPDLPNALPQAAPAYMNSKPFNKAFLAQYEEINRALDNSSLGGFKLSPTASRIVSAHSAAPNTTLGEQVTTFAFQDQVATLDSSSYWLPQAHHGVNPLAADTYKFYRNVADYGAKGDGITDDTDAINRAIADGNRCGANCGSTSVLSALVYFPPGTYLISQPLIQYYYTQFVGDPNSKPVIKGAHGFVGIALIDNDYYIPGGNGSEWYINQSNFYRQIRNFVLDMRGMNLSNTDENGQPYVPTGIHWQVGQATSLQNIDFLMDAGQTPNGTTTAVGIFMENGSGGFMSDLTFTGGNFGIRAGGQQFTARGLKFTSCLTAVSMIWDWGMTWQNIQVISCWVAFDCTTHGGATGQGTNSLVILDSHFVSVPYAIPVSATGTRPGIVIDNLLIEGNTLSVVLISGGDTILPGTENGARTIASWAMGRAYETVGEHGTYLTGVPDPVVQKSPVLLDSTGRVFARSKPQYEEVQSVVDVTALGVRNDMTGDQSGAINDVLAAHAGSVIFFPQGIYLVSGTIFVPPGTKIVGEGWSQIMGTGTFFGDASNPQVMIQVGRPGDVGTVEISDMLFTVRGPTAGIILMEWNIREESQGSVAMWDSHFRVGGADGSELQAQDCPLGNGDLDHCMASTLLLHVTSQASGYFENVWAWVADHDLDNPGNAAATEGPDGIPQNVKTNIEIYGQRGILIESSGPVWLYGTSSEHSLFYQFQIVNAANIYLGHMQTETPYYAPASPIDLTRINYAPSPFTDDPTFLDCSSENCLSAWAFRVINSSEVYVYSAGFYSFFQNNSLGCADQEACQERIFETNYATGLWVYNLFTKGAVEIISPRGLTPVFYNDSNQNGYTSDVAVWTPLGIGGSNIGDASGSEVVYIDPIIYSEPDPRIVQCFPPCTLVMPPRPLSTTTVISFPPQTTWIEVGSQTIETITANGTKMTTSSLVGTLHMTIISPSPLTTTAIPMSNVIIGENQTTTTVIYLESSIDPPSVILAVTQTSSSSAAFLTTLTPTPYPPTQSIKDPRGSTVNFHIGPPSPSCRAKCGSLAETSDGSAGGEGDEDPDNDRPVDDGDTCDPRVDDTQGFCDNGNFPLYNPYTKKIDCENSLQDVQDDPNLLSSCQALAMEEPEAAQNSINSGKTCCTPKRKRSLTDLLLGRQADTSGCKPSEEPDPPADAGPDDACATTYTCKANTPNVCANARSAIDTGQKAATMTRVRGESLTAAWRTGKQVGPGDDGKDFPYGGWRLKDCDVEEYPFAAGRPDDGFPTLRVVPKQENMLHSKDWLNFLRTWDESTGEDNTGKKICIDFEAGIPDESTEWGLDTPNLNICGIYGIQYLVKGQIFTLAKSADPIYARRPNLLTTVTQTFKPGVTKVFVGVPQFCESPSPGFRTYDESSGQWVLRDTSGKLIGEVKGNPPIANPRCVQPPPGLPAKHKRDSRFIPLVDPGSERACYNGSNEFQDERSTASREGLVQRQSQLGSYLDPNVYAFMGCDLLDIDPCEWGAYCPTCPDGTLDCQQPDYDGDGGEGSGGTSGTSASPISTSSVKTTTAPEITPAPTFISCEHQDQDPGLGIQTPYCVCHGSTFAESFVTFGTTSVNSCAYTAQPSHTINPMHPPSKTTSNCHVCTLYAENEADCTLLPGCTPTPTPVAQTCWANATLQVTSNGGIVQGGSISFGSESAWLYVGAGDLVTYRDESTRDHSVKCPIDTEFKGNCLLTPDQTKIDANITVHASYAAFDFQYASCSVDYKGQTYHGTRGGDAVPFTFRPDCVTPFPCEIMCDAINACH